MTEFNKLAFVKQVSAAVGRGIAAGFVRFSLAVLAAAILNFSCAAIFIFFNPFILGGGHGGLAIVTFFVGFPCLACIGIVGFLAYTQAIQGIVARVMEQQEKSNIAQLGSQLLEQFLKKINYQAGAAVGTNFLKHWQKFLQEQSDLAKPVRFVVNKLTSKVPLASLISELARPDMSVNQIAELAMTRLMASLEQKKQRPSIKPLLLALGIELLLWIVYILYMHMPAA